MKTSTLDRLALAFAGIATLALSATGIVMIAKGHDILGLADLALACGVAYVLDRASSL